MKTILIIAMLSGNAADLATTKIALGSGHAREANPLLGSPIALWAGKTAVGTAEVLAVKRLWNTNHRALAMTMAAIVTGVNGAIAAHNWRVSR